MAHPFSRLILELKKINPSIHGECGESWGAQNPEARKAIRTSIKNSFPKMRPADHELLAILDQPPRLFDRSVSISHTDGFGGWLATARPTQIGWDVEVKSRIKTVVIERVCTREEIEKAPNPVYLWSAKEAFFKSLEDDQPEVIAQLTIADWEPVDSDLWSWRGLGPRNGEGLLLDSGAWTLAVCLIP